MSRRRRVRDGFAQFFRSRDIRCDHQHSVRALQDTNGVLRNVQGDTQQLKIEEV
jgi:hypothetical protein